MIFGDCPLKQAETLLSSLNRRGALWSTGGYAILLPMLPNRPLTKKELGWLFLIAGVVGFIAILSVDILDSGRMGGIGPAQQIALGCAGLIALIGLTLIPLGDDTA